MKLKCTLQEYTQLVRRCQRCIEDSACQGCVLADFCGENKFEEIVALEIEGNVNTEGS